MDTRTKAKDIYDATETHGEIIDWIERAMRAEKALEDLFQECQDICLEDMDRLDKEIAAASAALKLAK